MEEGFFPRLVFCVSTISIQGYMMEEQGYTREKGFFLRGVICMSTISIQGYTRRVLSQRCVLCVNYKYTGLYKVTEG